MTDHEREALLAKGRKLFATCGTDRDYACVLGYVQHNLRQGGWRAETAKEFVEWLRQQSQREGVENAHAAAILKQLQQES